MKTIALVPAYNEADRIGATVKALLHVAGIDRVVVVDDGSTDQTESAAGAAGAAVIRSDDNLGKGGAVNKALAGIEPFDVVLLIDGDTGETAAEAGKLLEPVLDGRADMSVAILPKRQGAGGFGLALGLAKRIIKRKTGFAAEAPLSGQRALNEKAFKAAFPFAPGYGLETAMTIDILRAGLNVVEVPAGFAHDYTYRDVSGFIHRGRQFLAILKVGLRGRK